MKYNQAYLERILECITKIKAYTNELDQEGFAENNMAIDAVIRNFEIIGEATKMISESLKQSKKYTSARRKN